MIKLNIIITVTLFVVFALLLPIIIGVMMSKKGIRYFVAFVLGVTIFIVIQIIRSPLISFLDNQFSFLSIFVVQLVIIKGLSAGLFEEAGKFIGLKILHVSETKLPMDIILCFAMGYALCEIFSFFGFNNLKLLINALLLNNGAYTPQMLATPDMVVLVSSLNHVTFLSMVFSMVERICTIFFHVFTTYLIAYGIKARKKRYLPAAVLLHTLFNITGLLSISHYGPFIGRGVLVFEICVLYAGCRYFMKKALKKGVT